ncbi:uncharacterized protein [Coffea arabica]|uniref:Uncharacterized protein n=1 Tax=Coffea arabica TaxID=13443 RepID=A0ABM4W5I7_COFAR
MQSDTGPSTGSSRLAVVPQGLVGSSPPEVSSIPQLSNAGSSSPILLGSPIFISNNTTPNPEIHVTDQGTEKTPVENEGTQVNAMKKHVKEGEQNKALHTCKFDMEAMREAAAHWVLVHEHPFTILEKEGFNIVMRRGMPEWQKISQGTAKNDCVTVYEVEKKKLKNKLKHVQKVSISTDL